MQRTLVRDFFFLLLLLLWYEEWLHTLMQLDFSANSKWHSTAYSLCIHNSIVTLDLYISNLKLNANPFNIISFTNYMTRERIIKKIKKKKNTLTHIQIHSETWTYLTAATATSTTTTPTKTSSTTTPTPNNLLSLLFPLHFNCQGTNCSKQRI